MDLWDGPDFRPDRRFRAFDPGYQRACSKDSGYARRIRRIGCLLRRGPAGKPPYCRPPIKGIMSTPVSAPRLQAHSTLKQRSRIVLLGAPLPLIAGHGSSPRVVSRSTATLLLRAAPARRRGVRVYHRITRSCGAPTGPRSRGYAPQNRTAVEFGKQRLVASQGVLVGIGPQPQAAMFQDMRDPPANAIHGPGEFGITRRPTPFSVQP
jgi:hypothetical protein